MKILIIIAAFIAATLLAAYSFPVHAACVFADGKGHSDAQIELLKKASDRIESKFGSLRAEPIVYFFDQEDEYLMRQLNQYGSTLHLAYRSCLAIGPFGQNVDVVAHELMHAELRERTGFWNRTTKIPSWFDEGLAMQVDYRDQYKLDQHVKTAYVRELKTGRKFNQANSGNLTLTYGAVKSEVQAWPQMNSPKEVFALLEKVRQGSSFDSIWHSAE